MTVTVSVPCTPDRLQPATLAAVALSGLPYRLVIFNPDDPYGYGRWWRQQWEKGETVIVLEHDVVPTRGQLLELERCGHDWCSYRYDSDLYGRGPMFGLVRFAGRVMRDHPLAADVALEDGERRPTEVGWWEVDYAMARDLLIRGVQWHEHLPPVRHLHPGCPSGPP